MISVADMRAIEQRAIELGLSPEMMMENAGGCSARLLDDKFSLSGKNILLFCGNGNNAGDGFVLARHAMGMGAKVRIFLVKPDKAFSPIAKRNYDLLMRFGPVVFASEVPKKELSKTDIAIDAVFGIGISRDVEGDYAKAISLFNSLECKKVSLDCPSGLNPDTGEVMGIVARPDFTIAFYDSKIGMSKENSGDVEIVGIGLPRIANV